MAKYNTRNTGTENGIGGTRGMGGLLYFGERCQTFYVMSPNIPWNVAKHSGECPQTIRGMSSNILENVTKHSGEGPQAFRECPQTFRGMSRNILRNVNKHSRKCP